MYNCESQDSTAACKIMEDDLHADGFVTNRPLGMAGHEEEHIRLYLAMLACRKALAGEASPTVPTAGY